MPPQRVLLPDLTVDHLDQLQAQDAWNAASLNRLVVGLSPLLAAELVHRHPHDTRACWEQLDALRRHYDDQTLLLFRCTAPDGQQHVSVLPLRHAGYRAEPLADAQAAMGGPVATGPGVHRTGSGARRRAQDAAPAAAEARPEVRPSQPRPGEAGKLCAVPALRDAAPHAAAAARVDLCHGDRLLQPATGNPFAYRSTRVCPATTTPRRTSRNTARPRPAWARSTRCCRRALKRNSTSTGWLIKWRQPRTGPPWRPSRRNSATAGRRPRRGPSLRPRPAAAAPYRTVALPGGYTLYCGKSNHGNDALVRQVAAPDDLWFHAHGHAGAHVVLKAPDDAPVPHETLRAAAALAAYYSKGKDAAAVEVLYTAVRHVRKFRGARPGQVQVKTFSHAGRRAGASRNAPTPKR